MKFLYILAFIALTVGTAPVAAMVSGMTFKELCDGMCPAAFNPEDPKLNIQGPGRIEDFKRRMEPWRDFCVRKCGWIIKEPQKLKKSEVVDIKITI
ncbi:hypothetical protein OESDEN_08733 [Oesophagostomum dentatum]|uniref:Uncharacterized protein n=1 Tax=Oesophagostomum dentatum TaxID=61180 RepID=A0A0B1T5I1_OESDE|nr:hypothetical protein OESDEN_08733 [Oesophagostomum dentatum]